MLSTVKVVAHGPIDHYVPKEVQLSHKYRVGFVPRTKPQYHGVEVNGPFVWKDWIPGREYNKQIVLKNVKYKSDTISFDIPKTRVFATGYPKKVKLSAGTSYTIPVTFRPLENTEYHDKISVQTKEGAFCIDLDAILPSIDLELPLHLDFGMCAVSYSCELSFQLKNTGGVAFDYDWEPMGNYIVEPTCGTVDPQMAAVHRITFKPLNGIVYETDLILKYGPERALSKTVQLKGIGKYPHILLSAPGEPACVTDADVKVAVDFGSVPVGEVKEKWVDLHNLAPVRTPFKIEYSSSLSRIDTVFTCPTMYGVIEGLTTIRVPFLYQPKIPHTNNTDYMNVFALGNLSKSQVRCTGNSLGPLVVFSNSIVNFDVMAIGEKRRLAVTLVNLGPIKAFYQFCIDPSESVFKFDSLSGEIEMGETRTLVVEFEPSHPIMYYRRVTCLIHNQGPITLDLLATCQSDHMKPPAIKSRHVDRYRKNVENHISHYPPEQLMKMIEENKVYVEDDGVIKFHKEEELNAETKLDMSDMEEFFSPTGYSYQTVDGAHISLDVQNVDFGRCENMRMIDDKTIYLTNHTKGKVTVNWMTDDKRPFSIFPVTIDVPALKTMAFQLAFNPKVPNKLYAAELECFVSYKTMRDYTLVDETVISPPWCLTLNCIGQTFQANMETFIPRCCITPDLLLFPPANQHEASYRTLVVTNNSHTPLMFDIHQDSVFDVKPPCGLIPKESLQLVVIRAIPQLIKSYKTKLDVCLNQSENNKQQIECFLPCEVASVLMDNSSELYFKPTCIGSFSKKSYSFRNISRIPIAFEWRLMTATSRVLSVTPTSGTAQPNEIVTQEWIFAPRMVDKTVAKPQLLVWGEDMKERQSGGKRKVYNLRMMGEGTQGLITVKESYMNIGDITVGSIAKRQLTLYNDSDCTLHFKLAITELHDLENDADTVLRRVALMFDQAQDCVLSAHSHMTTHFSVTAHERGEYQFAVSYSLHSPQGEAIGNLSKREAHLCHVLVNGVFPSLVVTDVTCQGSNKGISKRQMWSLLSIDRLNEYLDASPVRKEVEYTVKTRPSYTRGENEKAMVDFNFSAAPVDSDAAVVTLMLENPGPVPTEWNFMLPSDLELELQYWSETADFSNKELHEMQIQSNCLFRIEPQLGRLDPGEKCAVTLTYSHMVPCTNRLPVMLKLGSGREILINFIGVTVPRDRRYIHFPATTYQFTPVPVAEKTAPIQMYELYNGGAMPLQYYFDLTPLDILRQENYDQDIFECLDPQGDIDPGQTAQVRWRFLPLEVKTYAVDIPICVQGGVCGVVTFSGIGYDRRTMGETMAANSVAEDSRLVPVSQTITLQQQLAYLSRDRINLGNVPLYSQCRSIVFVMNKSDKFTISYEWKFASKPQRCTMTIYPPCGKLEPGDSTLCRVIFTALGEPSFHDLDLVCEITNETEYHTYEKRLAEWKNEQYKLRTEFTITEDDPNADRVDTPTSSLMELQRCGQLASLKAKENITREQRLLKYKTLPPIKLPTSEDWYTLALPRTPPHELTILEKPTPPLPYLLHLGVTARTHDVRDFQVYFPDQSKHFYIDRFLSAAQRGITSPRRSGKKLQILVCKETEKHMTSTVLANVLRSLIDDLTFQEAVDAIQDEPIPYHVQNSFKSHPYGPTTQDGTRVVQTLSLPVTGPTDSAEHDSKANALTTRRSTSLPEMKSVPSEPLAPVEDESAMTQRSVASFNNLATSSPRVDSKHTVTSTDTSADARRLSSDTSITKVSANGSHETQPVTKYSFATVKRIQEEETANNNRRAMKKLAEVGNGIENVIENTLMNIMMEALSSQLSLTSRPCFAALPPRKTRPKTCQKTITKELRIKSDKLDSTTGMNTTGPIVRPVRATPDVPPLTVSHSPSGFANIQICSTIVEIGEASESTKLI